MNPFRSITMDTMTIPSVSSDCCTESSMTEWRVLTDLTSLDSKGVDVAKLVAIEAEIPRRHLPDLGERPGGNLQHVAVLRDCRLRSRLLIVMHALDNALSDKQEQRGLICCARPSADTRRARESPSTHSKQSARMQYSDAYLGANET